MSSIFPDRRTHLRQLSVEAWLRFRRGAGREGDPRTPGVVSASVKFSRQTAEVIFPGSGISRVIAAIGWPVMNAWLRMLPRQT